MTRDILDALVKSPKSPFSVIPAKAGIQVLEHLQNVWTPVFTGGDDTLRDHHPLKVLTEAPHSLTVHSKWIIVPLKDDRSPETWNGSIGIKSDS